MMCILLTAAAFVAGAVVTLVGVSLLRASEDDWHEGYRHGYRQAKDDTGEWRLR